MKAIYLLAAGAALTLASCSNDEVLEAPAATPIGFESFIGKTTRADDATMSNVKSITVYGYLGDAGTPKLFDGTIVTNTDGNWTYEPLQYWTAGKNYFFTAVASPALSGNNHYSYTWSDALTTVIQGFNGSGVISLNNASTAAGGNEDVLYASATATTPTPLTAAPERVQFAFKHALSRVKFTFANKMGSDAYSIKIHDLKINNTAAEGSLTLGEANPVWDATGSTALDFRAAYYTPSNGTAANAATVASGTKFIIPENKALTITFSIDLIVNNQTIATYNHSERALPQVDFQNGFSYNFVADITPENIDPEQDLYPILFNVQSVEGWQNADDQTVTLD